MIDVFIIKCYKTFKVDISKINHATIIKKTGLYYQLWATKRNLGI